MSESTHTRPDSASGLSSRSAHGLNQALPGLVGFAGFCMLAALSGAAANAAEPAKAVSRPPGTVQLAAAPEVLVNPIPTAAIATSALMSQPLRQPAAVVEPKAAGLGTMLLSMMALMAWIALRRR
jgi:hypothetical protein